MKTDFLPEGKRARHRGPILAWVLMALGASLSLFANHVGLWLGHRDQPYPSLQYFTNDTTGQVASAAQALGHMLFIAGIVERIAIAVASRTKAPASEEYFSSDPASQSLLRASDSTSSP